VRRIFEKCKRYIIDAIEDKDTDLETKKNYLEDIKEIIENLADDKKDTLEAIKKVEKKAENLRKEYEERLQAIDRDRFLLEESRPVIDEFLDFYRSVESDVILNIKDSTEKSKCTCGDKVVIPSNQVSAECKQVHPQIETDLNSILQRIFGPFRGIK
jgi:DNA repair exonuclease SbcCD ATPase subunit